MLRILFNKGLIFAVILLIIGSSIIPTELAENNGKIEFNIIDGPPKPDIDISDRIIIDFPNILCKTIPD